MFNPFGQKGLDEICHADLERLVEEQVAEGMFIEYKRDMPSPKRLAKSVAAFANSHGGWLFVGIEADRASNAAKAVMGVDLAATPTPMDTLRNAVTSHISPHPPYDARLIRLEGQPERAVMVVYIAEGPGPPYMLTDGRIYRRQGAGSDPVFETERAPVDELYARRDRALEQFRRFAQLPWDMPRGQAERTPGWVELYIVPAVIQDPPSEVVESVYSEPTKELKWWCEPVQAEADIDGERRPFVSAQIPFDTLSSSPLGYSVSQTSAVPDPAWLPLSVEAAVWRGGGVRVFLPLVPVDSEPSLDDLKPTGVRAYRPGVFVCVDCRKLIRAVMTIAMKALEFARRCGAHTPMRLQVRAKNVWLHVPYQATPTYERIVRNVGLPICRYSDAQVPPAEARTPYRELDCDDNLIFGVHVASAVLELLAIPAAYHVSLVTETFIGAVPE